MTDNEWVKGIKAGYDGTGRYRDIKGRFSSPRVDRETIIGQFIPFASQGTASGLAEDLESIIGGMSASDLRAAERSTDPMPGAILAMMRLAEYYCRTEGDVFQIIETPLDIALKPLEVQSADKGWQKDVQDLYAVENIDMFQMLYYIWLCSGIYGQAYPLEVWGEKAEDTKIALVPPKNVEVGRSFSLSGNIFITPPEGIEKWTKDLLETSFPAMVYNRYVTDWNEAVAKGVGIPIPQKDCFPVREKSLPFQRYAIPPIMRASRAISTRRVFEEMRRATVEGTKNQLWIFTLGDPEHMPQPVQLQGLINAITGLSGQRTGNLVWTGDLKVDVKAPLAPDEMMANETYVGITMEIFRRMGMSLKVVSGERGPQGGAGARAGESELDIQVLLERVKFKVNQMYRWERQFRSKLAEKSGGAAVKANKSTVVTFGKIGMEVEQELKNRLLPAFQAGPLSIQTFLQQGGWDWAIELQRKKEEEQYRELFGPPASFAQKTVSPSGDETTTRQTKPPGRPANLPNAKPPGRKPGDGYNPPKKPMGVNADEVVTAVTLVGQSTFESYVSDVYALFDKMVADKDIASFVAGLKSANAQYMVKFAEEGYRSVGGAFGLDGQWVNGAISYINSYADNFGLDIGTVINTPESLEDMRLRALMYPEEGQHLAYMYGAQQAMSERGARGWRRVLHPELSRTGPCMACISDSRMIHPISEGFWEPHPHGVCSAQSVAYYTSPSEIPIEIPVPEHMDSFSIIQLLKNIGKALGSKMTTMVRRIRGD